MSGQDLTEAEFWFAMCSEILRHADREYPADGSKPGRALGGHTRTILNEARLAVDNADIVTKFIGTTKEALRSLRRTVEWEALFQSVKDQYQDDMANHGYSADLCDEWDERCAEIVRKVAEVRWS